MTRREIALSSLLLLALVLTAAATDDPRDTFAFEARGWRSLGPASSMAPDAMVRVQLALPIRNEDALHERFLAVSTPGSPLYGQYLTAEQLASLIGPSPAHVARVVHFLTSHDASDVTVLSSGEYVAATLSAAAAERLFSVELHLWRHPAAPSAAPRLAATSVPRIPAALSSLVDLVSGLRELPLSPTQLRRRSRIVHLTAALASSANSFAANASAPPAPVITDLLASQTNLYITVTPVCSNGQPTMNPAHTLCADQTPGIPLLGFLVQTRSASGTVEYVASPPTPSSNGTAAAPTNSDPFLTCATSAKNPTSCIVSVPAQRFVSYRVAVGSLFQSLPASPFDGFYGASVFASDWVTPQLLHQQYGIPQSFQLPSANGPSVAPSPNRQAIASFSGQYFSPSDLQLFARQLGVPYPSFDTHGINDPSRPGDEAQLDVSMLAGVGLGVPASFYSITGGWLLEWAAAVLNQPDASFPLVNSISYSDNEDSLASQYGPGWTAKVDADFQKIAVRGGSVIVAAGDAGASNVGHGATSCASFVPQYPASSPYATAVGATMLSPAAQPLCNSPTPQYANVPCSSPIGEVVVAANNGAVWTSGGGVSNLSTSPAPAYQATAVASYLKALSASNALPPQALWNRSGRFYPDLSAIGSNLIIVREGQLEIAAGTSASTPIIAGLFANINAVLLSSGKPPLGFANPALYDAAQKLPSSFTDVTVGNINCGDVLHPPHTLCCPYGWAATVGYDAASGLGTPNFPQLVQYFLNLSN